MSHNQTIDGVSRKSLEQALKLAAVFDDGGDGADAESARGAVWILRALLDAKPAEVTGDDVLRWMDEHAAAQAQGWPLGEIVEFGTGLKEVSWREGKMPALGTKLYAEQPAPVAVVLPKRRDFSPQSDSEWGWNACLDEVARLTATVRIPEPLVMTDGLHTYEYVTGHNAAIDKMLGVKP